MKLRPGDIRKYQSSAITPQLRIYNVIKRGLMKGLRQQPTEIQMNQAAKTAMQQQQLIERDKAVQFLKTPYLNYEQLLQGHKNYFDRKVIELGDAVIKNKYKEKKKTTEADVKNYQQNQHIYGISNILGSPDPSSVYSSNSSDPSSGGGYSPNQDFFNVFDEEDQQELKSALDDQKLIDQQNYAQNQLRYNGRYTPDSSNFRSIGPQVYQSNNSYVNQSSSEDIYNNLLGQQSQSDFDYEWLKYIDSSSLNLSSNKESKMQLYNNDSISNKRKRAPKSKTK